MLMVEERMKLTESQIDDLIEFTESRWYSNEILEVIRSKSEQVGTVYRGIVFRKDFLKIGNIYEHWYELSSWSIDKEIAFKFAFNDYIPEGLIEDLYVERYGESKSYFNIEDKIAQELSEEFVPVVFVDKKGEGFYINDYLEDHEFLHEKEVVRYHGKWQIIKIEEKMTVYNKSYYEVTVQTI